MTVARRRTGAPEPERRRLPAIVLAVAVIVPLVNTIPTLDGYLKEDPPERIFLGFRHMAGDHFQYGSLVRQAAEEGRFFLENRYTTEPQRPSYVLLYFWLLGVSCRLTGISFPAMWEISKVVVGFAFLVTVWSFTRLFFRAERERLLAYVLTALSGGVGWLALLLPPETLARPGLPGLTDPVNFQWNWSTFCSALLPLWIAPSLLFLAAAILLTREPAPRAAVRWAAGLLIPPAIWFTHPHTGNAAYLAFGLYGLAPLIAALWGAERIPWDKLRTSLAGAAPFLASFALVIVYLRWARADAVFADNSRGALMWNPTYSVFLYPFTYGLLLPLALYGIKWSGSLPERPRRILAAWLASAITLSVNPLYSGAKFQYLVHLPVAIYAAHGILELRRRSERARALSRGVAAVFFGALLFLNAPLSILKDMPKTAGDRDIYLSRAEIDAMRFLDGQPQGSVLCGYRAGNRIAWLSRKKVFTGHWLLTLDSGVKDRELAGFFGPRASTDIKRGFLAERGLRYVYVGPDEARLGGVDPALGLDRIYDKDGIAIYRVP